MADQMPQQAKVTHMSEADKKDIEDNKVMAALSYVGILCLVPLLAAKTSKFAQFHAKQGLVLFVVDVVVSFIAWIPLVGWAIGMAALIVSIYGFVQALQGAYWELPYLGDYAKKINL
jgi:uncharacterized membrane protein